MREAGIPFGSYLLLKRLARGGMAEVFLARQRGPEGFDRRVALKRILPHLVDSEDFVRMFLDEARLAARLSHPNVVHIYEFGKVDEHYFIAMEYVDGIHAGALIERGVYEKVPPALAARIGADACAGLNYAHNLEDHDGRPLHLVHRDISPPNLMISYDGVVKLVDFGIAKIVTMVDKTRPGIVKGKFAYMSPEQTMGKKLDGRSDVFSLGLVIWELLAGCVALDRTDPVEAMKRIRDGRLPRIQDVRPDVPAVLAAVLEQALSVRPEARPSPAELGNAFEGFIKSSPELGTSMQLQQWIRTRFKRPSTIPPGAQLAQPNETRPANVAATPGKTRRDETIRAAPTFPIETNEDDAATQITGQPVSPDLPLEPAPPMDPGMVAGAHLGPAPGAGMAQLPRPHTPPHHPYMVQPGLGQSLTRFTGVLTVGRRRRIILAAVITVALVGMILLAMSPDDRANTAQPDAAPGEVDTTGDGGVAASATDAAPTKATLKLITDPPGAQVLVDELEPKESPAIFENLEPGEHSLLVVLERHELVDMTLQLEPGMNVEGLSLKREPRRSSRRSRRGRLKIVTRPSSTVYHGKKKLGTTPLANIKLKAGTYKLTFKRRGYQTKLKKVTIRAGRTTKVSFALKKR